MHRRHKAKGPNIKRVPLPFRMISDNQGQVLPVAILSLAILFLICIMIVVVAIGELRISTMTNMSAKAQKIAEAGVSRCLIQLKNDPTLSNQSTSDLTKLNWPYQSPNFATTPATPQAPPASNVHINPSFAGGTYQCWLYQDPSYPNDHAKKVIVSYGAITSEGVTYKRTIETKVNYTTSNPNYFDAFNFLIYNGNEKGNKNPFNMANYLGYYQLNGLGAAGDGWGIYSVGDVNLDSGFLSVGSKVIGNVTSGRNVNIGSNILNGIAPLKVQGTVCAGVLENGDCNVYCNGNLLQFQTLEVNKIYASQNVFLQSNLNLTDNRGAIVINNGVECGGKATVSASLSGGLLQGGITIGNYDLHTPTSGIKAGAGVEISSVYSEVDTGDIQTGYMNPSTQGGKYVGIKATGGLLGKVDTGSIESTGCVQFTSVAGSYVKANNIWCGTDNNTIDGMSFDTSWTATILGYIGVGNLVARGKVNITSVTGGLGVRDIFAGYHTESSTRQGVSVVAAVGGFSARNISSFGEVQSTSVVGGATFNNIYAGTNAVSGNGGTGANILVYLAGSGTGNIMSRGKAHVETWLGGAVVGNVTAGTDDASLHGGMGIEFWTRAGGATMGNAQCVGKYQCQTYVGGATVGNIVSGTDSTTTINDRSSGTMMGTGGNGVDLSAAVAGITTGSITCRGKVPLSPVVGGITTGAISAGTDDTSGNGGTGVSISGALAGVTTGSITSRGMVNINCSAKVISTGAITAGTNNNAVYTANLLRAGTGVNVSGGGSVSTIGNIISHGKVTCSTGAAINNFGSITAGDDQDNANEYGGTGVNINATVASFSGGAVTGRGKVILTATAAGITVGRVVAGTDNTGGSGGYGVTCSLPAGSITMGGIDSRGRVDLNASGSFGITVNGTCNVGTDSTTGWGGTGMTMASTVSAGVNITGLVKSRGIFVANGTLNFGCSAGGIYAGGTDTGSGYGGTGISITAGASGFTVGSQGDSGLPGAYSPGQIYEYAYAGSISNQGNVYGGSDSATGAGGTGVWLKTRAAGESVNGWVESTGKTYLDSSSILGSLSSWTIGAIHAGSDNAATPTSGTGIQHVLGGVFCNTTIGTTWYVGQLVYGTGDTSQINFGNIWTPQNVDFNNAGWSGLAHYMVVLNGYIMTPGYVSVQGGGQGASLSGGIHCGGNVYLSPSVGTLSSLFGGGKTFTVGDSGYNGSTILGAIESAGTVTLQPANEQSIFSGTDDCNVTGKVIANALNVSPNCENVEILNGSGDGGGITCNSTVTLNATTGPYLTRGSRISVSGPVNVNGDINLYCGHSSTNPDGGCTYSGVNWSATGNILVSADSGCNPGFSANGDNFYADGSITLYLRNTSGSVDFNYVYARGNIVCSVDSDAPNYWIDDMWANGTITDNEYNGGNSYQGHLRAQGNISITRDSNSGWQIGNAGGIQTSGLIGASLCKTGTINGGITACAANSNIVYSNGANGNCTINGLVNCQGPYTINWDANDNGNWLYINNGLKTGSGGNVTVIADKCSAGCSGALWICGWNSCTNYEYVQVNNGYSSGKVTYTPYIHDDGQYNCPFGCSLVRARQYGGTQLNGSDLGTGVPSSVTAYAGFNSFTTYTYNQGQPSVPGCPNPTSDGDSSTPDLNIPWMANPPFDGAVDHIYSATNSTQEDLALNAEPLMPIFSGSDTAFPSMAVGTDLPTWMNYSFNTVTTSGGAVGEVPAMPPRPTWGPNATLTPDFTQILPWGNNGTAVKMPTPQWDWWKQQAQNQGSGHYSSGDMTISLAPGAGTSSDDVYYAEGNVTINSMNFPNESIVHKATIIAAGITNSGDITITTSGTWKIYGTDELHLIAKNNDNLSPPSGFNAGDFSVGDQAVYQFYAGNDITCALSLFSSVLSTGTVRGNFLAGDKVTLTDPWNIGGLGWYNYSYYRPVLNPDGWIVPYSNRSWRELTDKNW